MNKADILIQSVEGKIGSFQKVVDRSEKRVDKINQHMRGIEESLLILKTRESDIKEIKDKFNELDGLVRDHGSAGETAPGHVQKGRDAPG